MSDNLSLHNAAPLDTCWKRIGVHGDKSCPLLAEHVHCRNCEVYAAAAIRLLDRFAGQGDGLDELETEETQVECRSLLIFRLGDEWLALATGSLLEVVAKALIHSLPHQHSRSLLGVTNVHGTLVACLSLAELLELAPVSTASTARRTTPRMLIVAGQGGPVVMPVDEVDGIHAVPLQLVHAASRGGGQVVSQLAAGVLQWHGRSVTLLDEERLRQAISRSLT